MPFANVAESLSNRCGSKLVSVRPGDGGVQMDSDSKHVVCMHMPQIKGIAPYRKEAMTEHGACHRSLPRRPKTERFTTELYLSKLLVLSSLNIS